MDRRAWQATVHRSIYIDGKELDTTEVTEHACMHEVHGGCLSSGSVTVRPSSRKS